MTGTSPHVFLPVFVFRGRRFRPRMLRLKSWHRPAHARDDYGNGRTVHRIWLGPLLITVMVENA